MWCAHARGLWLGGTAGAQSAARGAEGMVWLYLPLSLSRVCTCDVWVGARAASPLLSPPSGPHCGRTAARFSKSCVVSFLDSSGREGARRLEVRFVEIGVVMCAPFR